METKEVKMKFTPKNIEKIFLLLQKFGFYELEIEEEGSKLKIRASPPPPRQIIGAPVAPTPQPQTDHPSPSVTKDPNEIVEDEKRKFTRSPLVGTLYRAPSPTSPNFVEEGDNVEKGQVLCIVEAMKLMNEVEAEHAGKVVKILIENGKPVEYGEPLFLIDTAQ